MQLRELIATAQDDARPAWWWAAEYATFRLGAQLAGHIRWQDDTDPEGRMLGTLAGDDRAVTISFRCEEPGADLLQVQVTCPEDPQCPGPAWETVTDRWELLGAVEDGPSDEAECELHHAY